MSVFKIAPTTKTSSWWISQSFIPTELSNQLKEANVLFTPRFKHIQIEGPHFPSGTSDLLVFLRKQSEEKLNVDVCVGDKDDDYKELVLHSELLQLPDIIVQLIFAPVLAGLLVEFIKFKLGSRLNNSTIKSSITIEDEGKRSINLTFDGDAKEYASYVTETIRLVNSSEALETLEDSADIEMEARIQRLKAIEKK